MKHLLSAIALFVSAAVPVYAVDEHHPDQPATAPKAAAPKAPPKTAPDAKKSAPPQGEEMRMGMMPNMGQMQQQMHRIMETKDPKERGRLLQEHMKSMQGHMQMMGGMIGQGGANASSGMPMEKRMGAMEQRMDMMQELMKQMMQHIEVQKLTPH